MCVCAGGAAGLLEAQELGGSEARRSHACRHSCSHPFSPTLHRCLRLQGMPGAKAKLEFVRCYYEFLPKSLYTDTRAVAAAAP